MILTTPTSEHIPQLRAFRLEFLDACAPSEGSGSLLRFDDPADWLAHVARYADPETVPPDRVPCSQYLYVRESDGKIVGMGARATRRGCWPRRRTNAGRWG